MDATTTVGFGSTTEFLDVNVNTVAVTRTAGTITIGAGGTGGGTGGGGTGGGGGTPTGLQISVGSATVAKAAEVCLPVRAANFTNLVGAEFTITYDSTLLTYKSVKNLNLAGLTESSSFGLPGTGVNRPGAIKVSWLDNNVTGVTVPLNTTIFEVCFTAANRDATTTVGFGAMSEFLDANVNTVQMTGVAGTVTIGAGGSGGGGGGGTGTGAFTLDVTDASAQGGSEVCVPVIATNFSNILSLEFSLTFDPAKIQFKNVTGFNLNQLNESNFFDPSNSGTLKVSWNDPEVKGISVADGTTLFRACFTAIGSNTTAVVGFGSTSEVIKGDGSTVALTSSPGTITISGAGPGNSNPSLILGNATVNPGEDACVDMRVAKFSNLVGMEFTINYDSTRLEFKQVTGFGALRGLDGSVFGLPGVGLNKKGAIKVAWVDPEVSGVTLADSVSLFRVCFKAIGAAGTTTSLSFAQPIELTNLNGQTVSTNQVSGTISISGTSGGGGGGNTGRLQLILSDTMVTPNTDVCVGLSVQNFASVVGMEFTLRYSADSLTFKSIQNLNLSGLEASNFNTNNLGFIKLSWVDPQITGVTLSGTVPIFRLCFTSKALLGTTQVQVDRSQIVEITDTKDQLIPHDFDNGVIMIQQNAQPLTIGSQAQITQVACRGGNTGAIDISVQGGSGNYTYSWSFQNSTTQDLSNIPAGSYTVTVTDALTRLTASRSFSVTQPDSVLAVQLIAAPATCIGINNGSINAIVAGGIRPYSYAWSNGLPAGVNTHQNLGPGAYSITVTDGNGCTANAQGQVTQSAGVSITSVQPTPIDAGADGAVSMAVTGGTAPYTYSWTGPQGFSASSKDIANLSNAGTYCFKVTDAKGCMDTACVMVLRRLKFDSVAVREACFEASNGRVQVTVIGGKAPYRYLWSNGGTSSAIDSVKAGSYNLTVTDSVGTTINAKFEVPGLTALTITGSVTAARGSAGVANGSISLSVVGGKGAYTYRWSNSATTASIMGLSQGEYCITVTDGAGCSSSRCFVVDYQPLPLAQSREVVDNKCFGQSQGKIKIQVTGGLQPYSATFDDGVKIDADPMGLIERSNLPAGVFTYVVKDKEGSLVSGSAEIKQATAITLVKTTVRHDSDLPGCTGSISIMASGGAGSYNVRWNSNNAGSLITNLCEGQYVATVEDASGCSTTFEPIPVNTFTFLGQIIDNVCPGDAGGDVNLTLSGGAQPYAYFWLNSKGDTIARTKDLSNVVSGTYRVIVTESSGNSLLKEYAIGTRSSLSARALVTSNYRTYGVSCEDASDGIIEASATNGIGTNYIYAWLFNDQLVGSQQRLSAAKAGTYKLQITDAAGCMAETQVQVSAPPSLGISGSVNHISCVGARDGDILISASGGVPGSIYTYRWSTGATGPRISFLTKGNYTASVTDANNCTVSALFTVLEPAEMKVSVESTPATTAAPDCNGAARITVTGGTRPYAYMVNVPNAKPTDSVFLKLCPGDYALEVVDSRGCRTTPNRITFTILDRTLPCMDTRTVLTPDGDGANETLEIRCIEDLKENRVIIFNEWGQKVFEAENYSNNWNGRTSSGEELPEGAYFFVLEYTDIDGNRQQVKGSITLLRE